MAEQTVVVGADGSDGAQAALAWSANYAKQCDAKVHVVYAVDPTPWVLPAMAMDPIPIYNDDWRATVTAMLEGPWTQTLADNGVSFQCEILEGDPAREIKEYADKVQADLIVVGRRAKEGVGDLLLGSVPRSLAHSTKRPLTIVPDRS